MDFTNGVNPSSRTELVLQPEVVYHRDQPPPYTPENLGNVVTSQPVIHQTVIIQQTLKGDPTFYNCPKCQERVFTKVKYESSNKTHLLAGFICGSTLWCCLCCLAAIPYLVTKCKRTEHYCPNCGTMLGSYSKI